MATDIVLLEVTGERKLNNFLFGNHVVFLIHLYMSGCNNFQVITLEFDAQQNNGIYECIKYILQRQIGDT